MRQSDKANIFQQLFYYSQENGSYIFARFIRHFLISAYGVLSTAVVRILVGIMIFRRCKLTSWVICLVSIIQTIPFLAMIFILIAGPGLGANTMIVTVFLCPLLPTIKGTYTGVTQVDKNILDVGRGVGMIVRQRLFVIELPLSVSVIMADIRDALVVAIGTTTIGAFIDANGFGDIITRGTNTTDGASIILADALPATLMAIITDQLLGTLEKRLDPASKKSQAE